jgi:hypothetical protein
MVSNGPADPRKRVSASWVYVYSAMKHIENREKKKEEEEEKEEGKNKEAKGRERR